MTAKELIKLLELEPLAMEGGYFRRNYCSSEVTPSGKPAGTAIYFLLTPDTFSCLHKLPTDEVYHFYLGDPVELTLLYPDGHGETVTLGKELHQGMAVQCVVPADVWQGSRLAEGGTWALLGTTMAPGFEYEDFVAGDPQELIKSHPSFTDEIQRLTR